MKQFFKFLFVILCLLFTVQGLHAQTTWGENGSRTDSRDNAGLQGDAGAISGFYQTANPINFPAGASSWWHLLDVRHSNPANNYAMQFAGSFFDQNLYFRKTSGYAAASWFKVALTNPDGTFADAKIITSTSAGQSFFTGHQLGGTYSFTDGIFRAITDNATGSANFYFDGVTNGSRNFYVRADGQGYLANSLTIGTTDDHGYKLAVNGTIRSKEIKVEAGPWPDYVFKSNYNLPALSQLSKFIEQNHHLPDMPSDADVVKNGISLGEMNKLLVKKVEELTLYLIEKDRQVTDQQKELEEQKDFDKNMKEQLNQLTLKIEFLISQKTSK